MADPREISLDELPPELADQVRDALALVKCWTDRDEQGARVIFAALADEGSLEAVARVLASMFGIMLREMGIRPEWFSGFIPPAEPDEV